MRAALFMDGTPSGLTNLEELDLDGGGVRSIGGGAVSLLPVLFGRFSSPCCFAPNKISANISSSSSSSSSLTRRDDSLRLSKVDLGGDTCTTCLYLAFSAGDKYEDKARGAVGGGGDEVSSVEENNDLLNNFVEEEEEVPEEEEEQISDVNRGGLYLALSSSLLAIVFSVPLSIPSFPRKSNNVKHRFIKIASRKSSLPDFPT